MGICLKAVALSAFTGLTVPSTVMFVSNRFLAKPGSKSTIRKYYANPRHRRTNHNPLNYKRLWIPPFPIRGENAFELLEAAFDLQKSPYCYCLILSGLRPYRWIFR